jgi:hypothetical protein
MASPKQSSTPALLVDFRFTADDCDAMAALLAANRLVPASGPRQQPLKDHVEHCLWQLARFAHLASLGKKFRGVQFGLNLGRAQELLGSYGGVEAWWRTFEPLVEREDWNGILMVVGLYLNVLGLAHPPLEFLSRE